MPENVYAFFNCQPNQWEFRGFSRKTNPDWNLLALIPEKTFSLVVRRRLLYQAWKSVEQFDMRIMETKLTSKVQKAPNSRMCRLAPSRKFQANVGQSEMSPTYNNSSEFYVDQWKCLDFTGSKSVQESDAVTKIAFNCCTYMCQPKYRLQSYFLNIENIHQKSAFYYFKKWFCTLDDRDHAYCHTVMMAITRNNTRLLHVSTVANSDVVRAVAAF